MESTSGPTRARKLLFYVLGVFYKSNAAHDMVTVFYSEDLPNFFWDCNPSSSDDFSKERNVVLVDLNGQSDAASDGFVRAVI